MEPRIPASSSHLLFCRIKLATVFTNVGLIPRKPNAGAHAGLSSEESELKIFKATFYSSSQVIFFVNE